MSLIRISISSRGKDVKASGIFDSETENVIIFRGSNVKERITTVVNPYSKKRSEVRTELIDTGKIKYYKLKEDIKFLDPNIAAGVILGRNADGWARFKQENGDDLSEYKPKDLKNRI